jgi:uncharacterized GH25 family protein
MKKLAIYIAFVALLCTIAVAHEGHKHIKGKVTAINGQEVTVQVENGPEQKVVVTPESKLMKGDDEVKLSDLKVGDGVLIHGAEKDGKIEAEELRIRIAKPGTNAK